MSLSHNAERPTGVSLADIIDDQERLRAEARNAVLSFRALLEPLIQEAAAQQVQIKTSVDPELVNYFSNRFGKFRIGFYQNEDDGPIFQPLSDNGNRRNQDVEGLFVIVQKDFVGKRPLLPSEKRRETFRFIKEKMTGKPSPELVPTETDEPLETYLQGFNFFPGSMWPEEKGTLSTWAVSRNGRVYRASDLIGPSISTDGTPNLYYLMSHPLHGLPTLEQRGTADEALEFLKKEVALFLTEADKQEARRKKFTPDDTLGRYMRGLKTTNIV